MNNSDRNRVIAADVIARAMQDPQFRARLVGDPRGVLEEAGIDDLPQNVEVRVLENTAERKHIVLPTQELYPAFAPAVTHVLQHAVPLPRGSEIVLHQNAPDLQHIVVPVVPPAYHGELTPSHVQLLAAAGWEAINLYTTANAVAEANAAAVQNVAGATEAAAAAVAVVAIGVVLV